MEPIWGCCCLMNSSRVDEGRSRTRKPAGEGQNKEQGAKFLQELCPLYFSGALIHHPRYSTATPVSRPIGSDLFLRKVFPYFGVGIHLSFLDGITLSSWVSGETSVR